MTQAGQGRRRGANFTVRITDEERAALEAQQQQGGGPRKLGPWLLWKALHGGDVPALPRPGTASTGQCPVLAVPPPAPALPSPAGPCPLEQSPFSGAAMPCRRGTASVPTAERVILDLCAGSGSWSAPYEAAGYRVVRVTLPEGDVRHFEAPSGPVWGVLAAPPL